MKKLLILAAVIVAGVAANAASFKWTAANIYGSDGTTKWSNAISLYATGGDLSSALLVDTFTPSTAGSVSSTFSNSDLVAGTTYNFYFVLEDGSKSFTSDTKSVLAQSTDVATIGFGNMKTATQTASNWASSGGGEPVPEPTSGLLMLRGMAGLALKRKRA